MVTAVPAAGVIGEAIMAYVVAGPVVEKFGGDSLDNSGNFWRAWPNDYG